VIVCQVCTRWERWDCRLFCLSLIQHWCSWRKRDWVKMAHCAGRLSIAISGAPLSAYRPRSDSTTTTYSRYSFTRMDGVRRPSSVDESILLTSDVGPWPWSGSQVFAGIAAFDQWCLHRIFAYTSQTKRSDAAHAMASPTILWQWSKHQLITVLSCVIFAVNFNWHKYD